MGGGWGVCRVYKGALLSFYGALKLRIFSFNNLINEIPILILSNPLIAHVQDSVRRPPLLRFVLKCGSPVSAASSVTEWYVGLVMVKPAVDRCKNRVRVTNRRIVKLNCFQLRQFKAPAPRNLLAPRSNSI